MRKILFLTFCSLFLCTFFSPVKVKGQSIVITQASDSSYWTPYCPGTVPAFVSFFIKFNYSGFAASDSFLISVLFGDGTFYNHYYQASWFAGGNGYVSNINHDYLSYGAFDVTYTVTGPGGISDTWFVPAEVINDTNCVHVNLVAYIDANQNCIKDPGELPWTLSNQTYVTNGNSMSYNGYFPGINYTVHAVPNGNYAFTCPAGGIINFTAQNDTTIFLGVFCPPSAVDHYISTYGCVIPLNTAQFNIQVGNTTCNVVNGNFTLTIPSTLTYVAALPAPASVSGNVLTWNHSGLNSQHWQNVLLYANPDPSLQIGDTVCVDADIQLMAGDLNPGNNTEHFCAVVKSSWDPNNKMVKPEGSGPLGYVPAGTHFDYLINFQNTGNAPAHYVAIRDTIDTDLDISQLKITGSSHPCRVYFISPRVIEFRFPGIVLPDSASNQAGSHGFISYSIGSSPLLPQGTQLTNTAYIYFDNNPAVITNTTFNTISGTVSLAEVSNINIRISPNPVNDLLTIRADEEGLFELQVYNVKGVLVSKSEFYGSVYALKVAQFANGVYTGTLTSKTGVKHFRFVVQH